MWELGMEEEIFQGEDQRFVEGIAGSRGAGCRAEEGGRDGDREIDGGGVGREVCGGGKGWRCSDLAAAAAAAA